MNSEGSDVPIQVINLLIGFDHVAQIQKWNDRIITDPVSPGWDNILGSGSSPDFFLTSYQTTASGLFN